MRTEPPLEISVFLPKMTGIPAAMTATSRTEMTLVGPLVTDKITLVRPEERRGAPSLALRRV